MKIGDTLLRVEEISWVKVRRLTKLETAARWGLIASGVLFVLLMAGAKGTFWSLEAVLGLLPISFGTALRGHYRVASSGDDEESYLERKVQGVARPADLAEAMRGVGIGAVEYQSPDNDYYYVLRPERIAWVRPWFDLKLEPLWLVGLFGAYWVVSPRGPFLADVPIIQDLHLLDFPHGFGAVRLACLLAIAASCLAVAASYRQGVEMAAVGGIRDSLPLNAEDRKRVFQDLAVGEHAPPDERPAPPPTPVPREG